jgi:hypothetical protein
MTKLQELTERVKKIEALQSSHDMAIIKLQSAKKSEVTMLGKAVEDETLSFEDLKAAVKVLSSYKKQGIKQIKL